MSDISLVGFEWALFNGLVGVLYFLLAIVALFVAWIRSTNEGRSFRMEKLRIPGIICFLASIVHLSILFLPEAIDLPPALIGEQTTGGFLDALAPGWILASIAICVLLSFYFIRKNAQGSSDQQ